MSTFGEPWHIDGLSISDSAGTELIDLSDSYYFPLRQEQLDRIIACVNALAGIDDPAEFVERAKAIMREKEQPE